MYHLACNSFFFINVIASYAGFWSKIIAIYRLRSYMKAGLPEHGWSLTIPFLIMPPKKWRRNLVKREKGGRKRWVWRSAKIFSLSFIHNSVPAFSRASSPPNYGINTKLLLKPIIFFLKKSQWIRITKTNKNPQKQINHHKTINLSEISLGTASSDFNYYRNSRSSSGFSKPYALSLSLSSPES